MRQEGKGEYEEFTEDNINDCDCTFKTLVNQILQLVKEDGVSLKTSNEKNDQAAKEASQYDELLLKFFRSDSSSLLHKHLSSTLVSRLEHRQTSIYKSQLSDLIMSGLHNHDSSMGIYAADPESYIVFEDIFDPIIKDYHKVDGKIVHPNTKWGDLRSIGNFNKHSSNVISTRIRIARSIKGFPFNSKMTREDYINLENKVKKALTKIGNKRV